MKSFSTLTVRNSSKSILMSISSFGLKTFSLNYVIWWRHHELRNRINDVIIVFKPILARILWKAKTTFRSRFLSHFERCRWWWFPRRSRCQWHLQLSRSWNVGRLDQMVYQLWPWMGYKLFAITTCPYTRTNTRTSYYATSYYARSKPMSRKTSSLLFYKLGSV